MKPKKKKKKKSHAYSGEDEGAEEHVEDNNDHGANVNAETKVDPAIGKDSKYNENFDIVFSSLRPLDAEVANLISLSEMKRKVIDANSETLSRTTCALSPKLLNFVLDHILHWYRLCMPKTTSNSFCRASNVIMATAITAWNLRRSCSKNLQLMLLALWTTKKYTNDLYYKPLASAFKM